MTKSFPSTGNEIPDDLKLNESKQLFKHKLRKCCSKKSIILNVMNDIAMFVLIEYIYV